MALHESKVVLELTELEVKQILGTAVKQLVLLASEPSTDSEVETLGSVIKKCSTATRQISPPISIKTAKVG